MTISRYSLLNSPAGILSTCLLMTSVIVVVWKIELPWPLHAAACLTFLWLCIRLFLLGKMLSATYGLSFVGMLGIAIAMELSPGKTFNGVLLADVYTPEFIQIAYHVLLISGSTFFFVSFTSPYERPWSWAAPDFAENYSARWLAPRLLVLGVLLTSVLVGSKLITESSYGSDEHYENVRVQDPGGLSVVGLAALSTALVSAARVGGVRSNYFRLVLLVISSTIIWFRLLRGERSGLLILCATLAAIYWFDEAERRVRMWKVAIIGILCAILIQIWPYVRGAAFSEGLVHAASNSAFELFQTTDSEFDPSTIAMLPQSYWHLLGCISLKQQDISLNGKGFLFLIPQALPQIFAKALGYERPLNGSLRLKEYRVHAGGMYIIAEGYWEWGIVGSVLVAVVMALVARWFERYCRRSSPIVGSCYFLLVGASAIGIFYGLQPYFRSLEIMAGGMLLLAAVVKRKEREALQRRRMGPPDQSGKTIPLELDRNVGGN